MHYWNSEERQEKKEIFKTAPYDPRFTSANQHKRCWVNYVDFHKCAQAKGEDNSACQEFKYTFSEFCPPFWVEQWDEQRSEGRFPVREINTVEPKF